jgi:hypothetical protein
VKKIVFLLALSLLSNGAFSQKKKTSNSSILAKVDNVTAQIITDKKVKKIVLFVKNETGVDTLEVRKDIKSNFKPLGFTLSSITIDGVKLHTVTWKENSVITTKMKHEAIDITESQIWNVTTKNLLIDNTQKATHLKETLYLDKGKTVTHDVERKRNEGFEFILMPNGDLTLKTKTQENHYKYSKVTDKFESVKVTVAKSSSKKRR